MKNKTNTNISAIITQIEKEENLFSWKICEVYIWEILRVILFINIQEIISSESFGKTRNREFFHRAKILFTRLLRNAILRNPFLFLNKIDILILESGRKYKFEKEYIDIYTHFIEKKYKEEGVKLEVYETNFQFDSFGKKRRQHLDFIPIFSKLFSNFIKTTINKDELNEIRRIGRIIEERTGVCLDLIKIIKREIKLFKVQNFFYSMLLNIKSPKVIYLVNYMYYFALLNQAKIKKIKTIELQHGLIIKETLLYHFPDVEKGSLKYFPDEFHVWKDFIGNSGVLPLPEERIKESECNHLTAIRTKYKNKLKKEDFSILIASQPFFSSRIAKYILQNAPKMTNYFFYYKLHPMQFDSFFEDKEAVKLLKLHNVKIIKNEISIYELLSICRFTIGIYSTSLFEAPIFNSIPLILLHEETDYANSILESNLAYVIPEDKPLISFIQEIL